tara:strand:- start:1259 stop:1678 length:420 start_codon:yes stop_codon:yes gene_type:complete
MNYAFRFFAAVMIMSFALTGQAFASEKKAEGSSSTEFVKIDPLIFPIIDDDGVQQVVNLVVAIEVDGPSDAEKVKAMRPRLTDAYIQDMYGILHKHAALKGGVIQIVMIKERLNEATLRIMGSDIHTQVLLQHVQQRPI